MTKRRLADIDEVAEEAVELALKTLAQAIADRGSATWILAGGTSPVSAYKKLVARGGGGLDWSKITVAIGDERHAALSDPDSNWGQIAPILFGSEQTQMVKKLVPNTDGSVEDAAADYAVQLAGLVEGNEDAPRLDLVWLGVGEDGHTLSLFPGHPDFEENGEYVREVHNSPKPPPERITLMLKALSNVGVAVVFATGAAKKDALRRAFTDGLPIARVVEHIETHGGRVEWLYDETAWSDE